MPITGHVPKRHNGDQLGVVSLGPPAPIHLENLSCNVLRLFTLSGRGCLPVSYKVGIQS